MRIRLTILLILFICCNSYGESQEVEKIIQSGNEFYKKQQYEQAASEYSKAIGPDSSNTRALVNLGNSSYKKNSRDEAIKIYSELVAKTKKIGLLPNSYYNKGVVLGKQQQQEQIIETYKHALR